MTENLFGAQTSNVLANFTRWLGGIFFFLTLLLSILYARQSMQHSSIQAALLKEAAVTASPTPASSPGPGLAPVSGTGLSGTAALTGTEAPFSGAPIKLSAPAATPSNALLPAPTLGATPAPVSSGSAGH
jgi:hypothetical protein